MEYGSPYQWPWNDGVWGKAMTWSLILSSGNPSSSCVTNSLSAIPFICGVSVFKKKRKNHCSQVWDMSKLLAPWFFLGLDFVWRKLKQSTTASRMEFHRVSALSHIHLASSCHFESREATRKPSPGSSENLRTGVVPKIATPPSRGSAKNHFPNYNNKSFQLGGYSHFWANIVGRTLGNKPPTRSNQEWGL